MNRFFAVASLLCLASILMPFTSLQADNSSAAQAVTIPKRTPPKAIEKALDFLEEDLQDAHPSWQVYALLDLIQRRFALPDSYSFNKLCKSIEWPDYDASMIHLFQRWLQSDYKIDCDRIPALEDDLLNHLLAHSLNCDQCPLPANYYEVVDELLQLDLESGKPGYVTTHVLLMYLWIEEVIQRQPHAAIPAPQYSREEFIDILVQIVERERALTDLAFESMMLLYYVGADDKIEAYWIERILYTQKPTGGWGYSPREKENGHPTALALWVLLEWEKAAVDPKVTFVSPETPLLSIKE